MLNPTAAIIVIGNEILSGRTQDVNVSYIAQKLLEVGIKLSEVRIIPDTHKMIVDTILTLKVRYDYIFTTGGIGPTHDDITSQAIADAFSLPLELNQTAYQIIKKSYADIGQELNKAREKMAYIPKNSILINNKISGAPGFIIENIYVMAGVPYIMHSMLEQILPTLKRGQQIISKHIDVMIGESVIATDFANLQDLYPTIEMGSYPFKIDDKHATSLVLSSSDKLLLDQAYKDLLKLVQNLT